MYVFYTTDILCVLLELCVFTLPIVNDCSVGLDEMYRGEGLKVNDL